MVAAPEELHPSEIEGIVTPVAPRGAVSFRSPMAQRTLFIDGDPVVLDTTGQSLLLHLDGDPRLLPDTRPTPAPSPAAFTSAAVLAHKAKQVDDGVRAAIEVLIQRGAGLTSGRRLLLALLAERLVEVRPAPQGDAVEVLLAACRVGGVEATARGALGDAVRERVRRFRGEPRRSKPLGIYTWSDELTHAFQQDRLLAEKLRSRDAVRALAEAIHGDPRLEAMYRTHLSLNRALAGPFRRRSLRHALSCLAGRPDRAFPRVPSFFPPSDSPESRVERALSSQGLSARTLDVLVAQVRAGRVSLQPGARASWRALQVWALEALLSLPEEGRIVASSGYRAHLDELFKALLTLVRETHIKDVEEEEEEEESDQPGARGPVIVRPGITLEPVGTHYERMAGAYRFVRELCEARFGRAIDDVARMRPWAPVTRSLREDLVTMESLFLGAAEVARVETGARGRPDRSDHRRAFLSWRKAAATDPDLGADARTMVPLSFDRGTGEMHVCVFLGWTQQTLSVSFSRPPRVVKSPSRVVFEGEAHALDTPVVVEARVDRLLDRDELRTLCARHRTVTRIARALEGAGR